MTGETVARQRLEWVDTGRGIAIFLVALFHSANWLSGIGVAAPYWTEINEAMSTLRMPLFFAMSGLFAGKWLTAGWRSLWSSKLSLYVWVFLVWEVIGSLVFQLGLITRGACCGIRGTIIDLLLSPVMPRFELWFIWALALFFIVAKVTRRLDRRVQLLLTGAVSLLALSGWVTPNVGWSGSAKYYFFFLFGLYARDVLIRFGSRSSLVAGVAIASAWAALSAAVVVFDLRGIVGLYFVNCVVGVFAGISLSRFLSGLPWLRRIGTQTLPIYLAHTPIIILITFVVSVIPGTHGPMAAVGAVAPAAVAVIAVFIALMLYRRFGESALRFLYEQPVWVSRRAAKV